MTLTEYAAHDALGLADLVAKKQVSPKELAQTAAIAIDAINPIVNAVVETYADRIDGLNEATLGTGPFRGVPFLMKDVFGHEAGRRIEWGSRLCRGMVAKQDSHLCELFRAAGLNILGRSAAPEYSMSGTTESVLHGNTSTPWKRGFSAGGSTGGGMAAVMAGIVPIAHGSDIAGSIRIPASVCGGVGLKPSRARLVRPDAGRERLRPRPEFRAGEDGARCGSHARLPRSAADGRSVSHSQARGTICRARAQAAARAAHRLVDEAGDGR